MFYLFFVYTCVCVCVFVFVCFVLSKLSIATKQQKKNKKNRKKHYLQKYALLLPYNKHCEFNGLLLFNADKYGCPDFSRKPLRVAMIKLCQLRFRRQTKKPTKKVNFIFLFFYFFYLPCFNWFPTFFTQLFFFLDTCL